MSEEKKNPPRAQIFRYFRIESRNKNAQFGLVMLSVIDEKNHARFALTLKLTATGSGYPALDDFVSWAIVEWNI